MRIIGKGPKPELVGYDDLAQGDTYRVHHEDFSNETVYIFTDEAGLVSLNDGTEYLLEGRHSDSDLRTNAKYEQVFYSLVEV